MLFHFSENPSIKVFEPLANKNFKDLPPAVWAIDEKHSVNYFFPRDCPRVIFSKSNNISEKDAQLFFSATKANTIIAVESAWLETIRQTTIYKYTFPADRFTLFDETAGYYISYSAIKPIAMEPVDDLLGKISSKSIELRVTPSLYPLRDAIVSSTIDDFSIIRFRNAKN